MATSEISPELTPEPASEVATIVRDPGFDSLFDIPRSRVSLISTSEKPAGPHGEDIGQDDKKEHFSVGPVIDALKSRLAEEAQLDLDTGPYSPYRTDHMPVENLESLNSRIQINKQMLHDNSRMVAVRMPGYLPMLSDVARYFEASIMRGQIYTDLDEAEFAKQLEVDHADTDDDSNFLLILDSESLDENALPKIAGIARISGPESPLLETMVGLPDNWEQYVTDEIVNELEQNNTHNIGGPVAGNIVLTSDQSSLLVAEDYRDPSYGINRLIAYELHTWNREGRRAPWPKQPSEKEIQPAPGVMRINLSAHELAFTPKLVESAVEFEGSTTDLQLAPEVTEQETNEKAPKFTIRAATLEDIPAIVDVDMRSFESVYKGYEEDWETIRTDLINKFTGRYEMIGGEWITVLERDGVMVGHMMSCPTSKKPEAFESWEETTDNGTLKTTYDPNGSEIYIISLAWLAEGADGMDMLYAHQMAKGLRKGYKRGFFESRVPGFRQYARKIAKKEGLSLEDLTPEQLDEYADTYFQTTINRGGKAMPLDPLLRKYAGIGCNLLKLVPNAYQDEPSMNYGVVCTYDFSNLFDGSVLQYKIPQNKVTKLLKLDGKVVPFKVPRNRMTEWMFGVALGAASHSQKAVNEIF